MTERVRGVLHVERATDAVMGDFAQCEDRVQMRHARDLGDEKLATRLDLERQGFVLRRYAAHGIGDGAIDEFESIVGTLAIGSPGETVFRERGVKKVAGIIAGERTTCPVRAMQSGRETDDQEPGIR